MARVQGYEDLLGRLQAYKKKYYQNLLIKGILLALAIALSAYLLVNSLEYSLRFSTPLRAVLLFGFLTLVAWALFRWILHPIWKLFTLDRHLSDQEAAGQIGRYFPQIKDKLLNTIQLHDLSVSENALISASISQKSQEVSKIPFVDAVNFKENRKYLKFLGAPLIVVLIILLAAPQLFTESTPRLINFNKTYAPVAPFNFNLINEQLTAFKNEDFSLALNFSGTAIPNTAYLRTNDRRIKMQRNDQGLFEFTFTKIQSNTEFQFEAAGYNSNSYTIEVVSRPNLKSFDIDLEFPRYLQKQNESLQNTGNLQIPEGTTINWSFKALETEKITLSFAKDQRPNELQTSDNELFEFKKVAKSSDQYTLNLQNEYSSNKEQIEYRIDVIEDKYPEITLDQFRDTTLFSYMVFGGNISDDYGLSQLRLYYSVQRSNDSKKSSATGIPISLKTQSKNQSYFFQWDIDSLRLEEGDKVNYYLQVWDNDGVNGAKSTKTAQHAFKLPTKKEINEALEKQAKDTENQIDESLQDAKELSEKIEEAEDRLKTKKTLDWQDKKLLEEIIERKEALSKDIER